MRGEEEDDHICVVQGLRLNNWNSKTNINKKLFESHHSCPNSNVQSVLCIQGIHSDKSGMVVCNDWRTKS